MKNILDKETEEVLNKIVKTILTDPQISVNKLAELDDTQKNATLKGLIDKVMSLLHIQKPNTEATNAVIVEYCKRLLNDPNTVRIKLSEMDEVQPVRVGEETLKGSKSAESDKSFDEALKQICRDAINDPNATRIKLSEVEENQPGNE